MAREKLHWFSLALKLKGSVIPAILYRVVLCGLFGVVISVAYYLKLPVSQKAFGTVIPSIVLGLLLVFRTNTAYDRFWEGRRLWGGIVINSLNLARQIWLAVPAVEPEERARKISVLRLVVAFAVATKLHLRGESLNAELEELMSSSEYFNLKTANSPPLKIAFLIGDYFQHQYNLKNLNPNQLSGLHGLLNTMVESFIGCDRILRTPMPLAYAIHLKQLLLLFCVLLPFQLVADVGWLTGLTVALVSFTLFGIEEIGIEIENPFGYDANDLPLDAICTNLRRNVDDLMTLTPGVDTYSESAST
ncbi:MAG: bestrophin family ion channel [Potamolinea sp.]